jgi:hypothetical protein
MVPLLAKNAVQIKSGFKNARMTGNYECAYALGILTANAGLDIIDTYENIIDLRQKTLEQLENFKCEDDKINQIYSLVKDYEASLVFDDQMKELYRMGFADKKL